MSRSVHCPFILCFAVALVFAIASTACNSYTKPTSEPPPASTGTATGPSTSDIMTRFYSLDRGRDSVLRMKVKIAGSGGGVETGTPGQVEVSLYNKRTAGGGRLMLIEFLSPAQERDRDALITITPKDEVEGIRYVQSNNSFLVTKGVTNEDALFGMTIQELADGQPEKYDYTLIGQQELGPWEVYKLDGKLKPDAESKFARVTLYLSKDSYAAVGAEFYDSRNELLRRLTVSKLELISGHWTRKQWTLENPARNKRLEFETVDARYDQGLSDAIFSRDHLKKLATK